jgi:predicted RNase H-like nuclease
MPLTMPLLADARAVGGLDGCRAGWVLATIPIPIPDPTPDPTPGPLGRPVRVEPAVAAVRVIATFGEALALIHDATLAVLGVDMPIGLPDHGPRAADLAARRRLGRRGSSVFPTPPRAVLGATDYPEALARSRAVDGRGLSKQAFHLLPKIAEIDHALRPDLQDRVFECHPEVAFARLAAGPLSHPKRLLVGREERLALLHPLIANVRELAEPRLYRPRAGAPPDARPDDVLDALVVALSAARVAAGTAERLGDGATDARALRMEIIV